MIALKELQRGRGKKAKTEGDDNQPPRRRDYHSVTCTRPKKVLVSEGAFFVVKQKGINMPEKKKKGRAAQRETDLQAREDEKTIQTRGKNSPLQPYRRFRLAAEKQMKKQRLNRRVSG